MLENTAPLSTVSTKKNVAIPGMIGNLLEWYDFSLYGYFASVLAGLFFPSNNEALGLIKTFGIFAAGFLMRPIGAIIFGHFGDRYGRKTTLAVSVILMAISTALIGLLPTHATIGQWAGVLLIICRLLQGLAVGGEFTGSIIYIIEHSPAQHRGLSGSWALLSAIAGLLVGSLVGAFITGVTAGTTFENIAWRIPFIFGIVLGGIGLYLRLKMPETPTFIELAKNKGTVKNPLIDSFKEAPLSMLKSFFIVFLPSVTFYLCFVYLSSYLKLYLHIPLSKALLINSISMAFILILVPKFGSLSDKYGRKPIIIVGTVASGLLAYPLFLLLQSGSIYAALAAQIGFAALVSLSYAAIPTTVVEMFTTKIRYTAMSFPYNLANTIFGGTAPLVATYLINSMHTILAPSFYLIFAAIISLLFALTLEETFKKPLL